MQPGLAFVRVGEDPASRVYVGMKERMSGRLGIRSETRVLPAATTEAELLAWLARLNADPRIHGILVQAPLPKQINPARVYATVLPQKDVDGFHPRMWASCCWAIAPVSPLHAGGHSGTADRSQVNTDGADVVILGRGDIVGKPMAAMLCQKGRHANATVTICHSRTRDIAAHCRRADILIAAIGQPWFVKADMVKPGAVVIDVGVNRIPDSDGQRRQPAGRGRGLCRRAAHRRTHHSQSRRGGSDDHRHADAKHRARRRNGRRGRLIESAVFFTFMQPARILPDLQCSLLCEEVRQEANGNFFLVGIMDVVRVPQVPVTAFKLTRVQPVDRRLRPVHRMRAADCARRNHGAAQE